MLMVNAHVVQNCESHEKLSCLHVIHVFDLHACDFVRSIMHVSWQVYSMP